MGAQAVWVWNFPILEVWLFDMNRGGGMYIGIGLGTLILIIILILLLT